jgi:hypothetical protein
MRRLATLCLGLIGAALAGSSVVQAQHPAGCPTCGGSSPAYVTSAPGMAGPDTSRHAHPHTRHCPKCQLERAQRHAGNNPIIVTGPDGAYPDASCAACGQGGMVLQGEAPGFAMLGPGTTSVLSPEPAPIGVVQTTYQPGGQPLSPNAMMGPGYGARPALAAGYPAGAIPPAPTPYVGGPRRRTSVLGHLFGLDGLAHLGDARRQRQASAHAAMRLGNPGSIAPVTELPASVVYGR